MFNYGQSSQNLLKTLLSSACLKSYPKIRQEDLVFTKLTFPRFQGI